MSKSYKNKVELKDGQIILFHRQHAKRPIYHMRIHVRGMRDVDGSRRIYVQETTDETDLDEAKRGALEKFDDLRLRMRDKKPAKELRFSDMYALWWAQKEEELRVTAIAKGCAGKVDRIEWHGKCALRYFLAYFGDFKLDGLEQKTVQGFWAWRLRFGGCVIGKTLAKKSARRTQTMQSHRSKRRSTWNRLCCARYSVGRMQTGASPTCQSSSIRCCAKV
jgi:hypothetical protein